MGLFEIISVVLKFVIALISNRMDPVQAKLRAAAQATKDLNDDHQAFNDALKNNDADAISKHFEQLRDRVSKATGGRSGGPVGPASSGDPK